MKTRCQTSFWSETTLQRVLPEGEWLVRAGEEADSDRHSVVIDSRLVERGSIFAALKGEHVDGHDFIHDAANRGAWAILVERDIPRESLTNVNVRKVPSVVNALAALALDYRKTLRQTTFIGITGSSGKTTTKDLLAGVLRQAGKTSASTKSFNNHLGVPLTILNATPDDRFVVCEIGTNAPGEIAHLTRIVSPQIALITNVGTCHVLGLGSLDGIAREKASLLAQVQRGGVAFVCADQPELMTAVRNSDCALTTFGFHESAQRRIVSASASQDGTEFTLDDGSQWSLALIGTHHAVNATAAIAVARHMGLDDSRIALGLTSVTPAPGRFEAIKLGRSILYDDSYNANPESMSAALRTFFEITTHEHHRALVLGDMLELGQESQTQHEQIGRLIGELTSGRASSTRIILLGPAMAAAADVLRRQSPGVEVIHGNIADDDAINKAVEIARGADRILVKGSRLNRLDRIAQAFEPQPCS